MDPAGLTRTLAEYGPWGMLALSLLALRWVFAKYDAAQEARIKEGKEIERAFIGIQMIGVTEDLARDLNLESDSGALIQEVTEDGPAAKAGLRAGSTSTGDGVRAGGDLIVEVDGKAVKTPDDVPAAIADKKPGDKVEIVIYRGDDRKTVEVELGKRPAALNDSGEEAPPGGGGTLPDLP